MVLFEAQGCDTMIAETQLELASFLAEHCATQPDFKRPIAYWLGRALVRLQAGGRHETLQRVRLMLRPSLILATGMGAGTALRSPLFLVSPA